MERTCNKCGETKPITEFGRIKSRNYIRFQCKCCLGKYEKEYRNKNQNIIKEKSKLYRKNHKSESLAYYETNRDKLYEYRKEYYKQNKGKVNYLCTQYFKKLEGVKLESYYKKSRLIQKKCRDKLTDYYISKCINQSSGLSISTIKKYPELIEVFRVKLKIKRLIKNAKNENN